MDISKTLFVTRKINACRIAHRVNRTEKSDTLNIKKLQE
jgi:hypothetical protein